MPGVVLEVEVEVETTTKALSLTLKLPRVQRLPPAVARRLGLSFSTLREQCRAHPLNCTKPCCIHCLVHASTTSSLVIWFLLKVFFCVCCLIWTI